MANNTLLKNIKNLTFTEYVFAFGILISFLLVGYILNKIIFLKLNVHKRFKLLFGRLVFFTFIFLGFLITSHELGLHIAIVTSIISVFGFVVGVAGKYYIDQLIAGFRLTVNGNLEPGDLALFNDGFFSYKGILKKIGLFFTYFVAKDEKGRPKTIIVPNHMLTTVVLRIVKKSEVEESDMIDSDSSKRAVN